jgi:hypothetical protein
LSLEIVRMQAGGKDQSLTYYPAARKLFEKLTVLDKDQPPATK